MVLFQYSGSYYEQLSNGSLVQIPCPLQSSWPHVHTQWYVIHSVSIYIPFYIIAYIGAIHPYVYHRRQWFLRVPKNEVRPTRSCLSLFICRWTNCSLKCSKRAVGMENIHFVHIRESASRTEWTAGAIDINYQIVWPKCI